jgi:hypothetical protein
MKGVLTLLFVYCIYCEKLSEEDIVRLKSDDIEFVSYSPKIRLEYPLQEWINNLAGPDNKHRSYASITSGAELNSKGI